MFLCFVLQVSLHIKSLALKLTEIQQFLFPFTEPFLLALVINVYQTISNGTSWSIESAELAGQSLLLHL